MGLSTNLNPAASDKNGQKDGISAASSTSNVVLDAMVEALKLGVPDTTTNINIEKANTSDSKCKLVTFSPTHMVYERDSYQHTTFVKIPRNPADHWRQFGALRHIHEIGGWKISERTRDKKNIQYVFVHKGAPLPKSPSNGALTMDVLARDPLLTLEDFYKRKQFCDEGKKSTDR